MKVKKLLKEGKIIEVLKMASFGSTEFRKAVQKAYMSNDYEKYIVGKDVCFEQGSGRVAKVPMDIVEDIIGTAMQLSRRVA